MMRRFSSYVVVIVNYVLLIIILTSTPTSCDKTILESQGTDVLYCLDEILPLQIPGAYFHSDWKTLKKKFEEDLYLARKNPKDQISLHDVLSLGDSISLFVYSCCSSGGQTSYAQWKSIGDGFQQSLQSSPLSSFLITTPAHYVTYYNRSIANISQGELLFQEPRLEYDGSTSFSFSFNATNMGNTPQSLDHILICGHSNKGNLHIQEVLSFSSHNKKVNSSEKMAIVAKETKTIQGYLPYDLRLYNMDNFLIYILHQGKGQKFMQVKPAWKNLPTTTSTPSSTTTATAVAVTNTTLSTNIPSSTYTIPLTITSTSILTGEAPMNTKKSSQEDFEKTSGPRNSIDPNFSSMGNQGTIEKQRVMEIQGALESKFRFPSKFWLSFSCFLVILVILFTCNFIRQKAGFKLYNKDRRNISKIRNTEEIESLIAKGRSELQFSVQNQVHLKDENDTLYADTTQSEETAQLLEENDSEPFLGTRSPDSISRGICLMMESPLDTLKQFRLSTLTSAAANTHHGIHPTKNLPLQSSKKSSSFLSSNSRNEAVGSLHSIKQHSKQRHRLALNPYPRLETSMFEKMWSEWQPTSNWEAQSQLQHLPSDESIVDRMKQCGIICLASGTIVHEKKFYFFAHQMSTRIYFLVEMRLCTLTKVVHVVTKVDLLGEEFRKEFETLVKTEVLKVLKLENLG